ncbi:MAG: DNA primase [Candidatus Nomurabacteria bacterium]|jgi:DNA primase|nr:DNA primase [Candidatus Nomurabacteria bacterium]
MDAKEEVRSRLAIEDVIGEYVQLKRKGRYWFGLSPFSSEKTPSFSVNPEKNIWHDFSSGRGGDIFAFIMEIEGLDFRGALEMLARKAGVELQKFSGNSKVNADKKKRYLEANVWAKKFFQSNMVSSKPAQEYIFKKRRLSVDTAAEWGIGFAPDGGGLVQFLLGKKFTDSELKGAGLMSLRGYDMFRGRMMVPLSDSQGQVVGFTGRIIGEGEPKYLNTPATLIYDKGRQVFGLYNAKEAIRKSGVAVLVEGNLDVISSHQAGVKNVVACAGTALTLDHLKALNRLAGNIYLGFDADKAGIAATERAIGLAQNLEIDLFVIEMPAGAKDPDELIQQDIKLWQAVVERPKSAVQWVIDQYARAVNLDSAEGKKQLASAATKVIAKLRDPVEAEHYLKQLSKLIDTSLDSLRSKVAGGEAAPQKVLKKTKVEGFDAARRQNTLLFLNQILAIALSKKDLRSILNNLPDAYLTEVLAKVKYHLLGKRLEIDQELSDKLNELEMVAEKIAGDKRLAMLGFMKELESLEIAKQRDKFMSEFANADEADSKKIEILNGAVKNLNQTIKTLKKTGPNDEFTGLFAIWDSRKDNDVV